MVQLQDYGTSDNIQLHMLSDNNQLAFVIEISETKRGKIGVNYNSLS